MSRCRSATGNWLPRCWCWRAPQPGFLVWNYPRGLIFAGDGGAYLWGVVIAIASVLLVLRHRQVSPWFPLLLLIYPVWETFFSIYRKIARGQSPGVADALHFHQLIYRRIVREVFDDDDEARRMLMRNNRTSPYLWGFALLTVLPAVLFWNQTPMLMLFILHFHRLVRLGVYQHHPFQGAALAETLTGRPPRDAMGLPRALVAASGTI